MATVTGSLRNKVINADTANLTNATVGGTLTVDNVTLNGAINFQPDTGVIISVDNQSILKRDTVNGAITIGHDDAIILAAGDTNSTMNSNINEASETIFLGAEGGFIAYAFPNNDTSWSNRKELQWNGSNLSIGGTNVINSSGQWVGSSSGLKGDTGATGATGSKGQKGEVGATGGTGAKGNTGATGAKGSTGSKGQKGEVGAKGNTGATGGTGGTGSKGQKGEVGATGSTGGTGSKGQKGDTGAKGNTGATGGTGATGSKGQKGEVGAKGNTGATGGTGATGSKGQKGEVGAKGNTGATGGTGGTGSKGQKGQTGATGGTGSKGQKGEVGAKGNTGSTGAKGQKGESGAAAARGTGQNYVASSSSTSNRGNYGAGVWAYSGYSSGSNRPFTYDATLQVMPNGSMGFELSTDWISQSSTPIKIRSLRDCCQGWSSYSTIWTSSTDGSGSGLDADTVDGIQGSSLLRSDANDTASGQYNFTKVNDHAIKVGTIRGTVVGSQSGEYIHMYNRVHIGSPNGWGSRSAPTYGLSVYGSAEIATDTGTLTRAGHLVWDAGNDGSGSGLDADTVDGIQASSFLRSDTSDTFGSTSANQNIRFNCNSGQYIASSGATSRFPIEIYAPTANGGDAGIAFHISGDYAGFFGLASDWNDLAWGGWSVGSSTKYRIWHSGNDGSGSGLDADTCDGQHLGTGANVTHNQIYANDWFRVNGSDGIYWQSYGGGWQMIDSTWMRVYNSKKLYVTNEIAATGNITAYYSDERLKTKTGSLDNALEKVKSLEGFTYVENELAKELGYNSDKQQVGVSAQQVQAVLPEAVSLAPCDYETLEDGEVVSKSGEDYLTVDYSRLVPLLIESIKELKSEVDDLKSQLSQKEK